MISGSKILIIEDDKPIVDTLKMILDTEGYKTEYSLNGADGLKAFTDFRPDVVLLDIRMPKMDGIEVLQEIKKVDKEVQVIMISGHGNIETAVQTIKLGAYDYISKPFDFERLKVTLENALRYRLLLKENIRIRSIIQTGDAELIGSSPEINKLKDVINKVSGTSSRVLITGENGTGKKIVARLIHNLSERSDQPFVHVNCATIPSDTIEIELFGCVEKYLPFSPNKRTGKIEQADGGTLFLDEVSDLSLESQSKILTVLSENKIEPLGSGKEVPVNIRVISSTNRNLLKLIEEGKFREDLYHRLNVISIEVPPLRARRDDIPELINYFSKEISIKNNIPIKTFTPRAIEYLKSLKWPGNVRELKNAIERFIILSDSDVIDREDVSSGGDTYQSEIEKLINSNITLRDFQDLSEKIFLEKKLNENSWNVSKTAEALDMQRSHLYTKMKQLHIENPDRKK
ncbi:MAG: sigma-54 dependent transcriptional regulator [Ignavibacteria bacterium]|nr:sigma-54 dependent transcriptional regulator [Ignavibacteria bacterium]